MKVDRTERRGLLIPTERSKKFVVLWSISIVLIVLTIMVLAEALFGVTPFYIFPTAVIITAMLLGGLGGAVALGVLL